MVTQLMREAQAGEPGSEALVPPEFTACVAHLRSEAALVGGASLGASQLRRECRGRYGELLQRALERLIADEWLIGGAREVGAPVDDRPSLTTQARLASVSLRSVLVGRVRPASTKQILSYYTQHRFHYLARGERDLDIVRSASRVSSAKARAEIASGSSFARVAQKQTAGQPADSYAGAVQNLQPHYYGEPNLNEAIFTAKPGVLVGPIDTWFGWFVFRVTSIVAEREQPLATVQAAIGRTLTRPRQQRALAAFQARWRATWRARTDCAPADVVPDCRQSRDPPVASLETPSPLE